LGLAQTSSPAARIPGAASAAAPGVRVLASIRATNGTVAGLVRGEWADWRYALDGRGGEGADRVRLAAVRVQGVRTEAKADE
jgi:hypothetical protein